MTEIVERLRAGYAGDAPFPFDRAPMALTVEPVYLVRDHDMREIAASLAAKDKEIERRDSFIKELSDALIAIRPLGGSELFVKRFGQNYADPVYCKAAIASLHNDYHRAMKGQVRERKRAEQAERALADERHKSKHLLIAANEYQDRLASAVEVIRRCEDALSCCYNVTEWPADGSTDQDKAAESARAFVAQHDSESREGK
jgi:hypothetical protein